MKAIRCLAVICVFGVLTANGLVGQDKSAVGKVRGQLPPNWKNLGLSDEQKQKVYKVQHDADVKIDELKKQINDLEAKKKKELEALLTPAQKARLREIMLEKAPSESRSDTKKDGAK